MSALTVCRVHTDSGSHIEPPLDSRAPKLDRLRWFAAVVVVDTGLAVDVEVAKYSIGGFPQRGYFNVRVGSSTNGPMSYHSAWSFLTGVIVGGKQKSAP